MSSLIKLKDTSPAMEHLVGIGLLLAFLLPHTSTLFLMVNPLLCITLVLLSSGRRNINYFWIVLIPLTVSLVFNIAGNIAFKSMLSWLTIAMYFTLFPFVGPVRLRNSYLTVCLAFIILSQLVYLLDIGFLTSFIDTYYPISESDMNFYTYMQRNISYDNMIYYRLGGLYRNPNQCSRYLTFLLTFYLVSNRSRPIRRQWVYTAFAFGAILLTGSRTGLVVAVLILFFSFFRRRDLNGGVKILIGIAVLFAGVYWASSGLSEIRAFDFQRGLAGSFDKKWWTFYNYYLSEESVFSMLFGHLDPEQFHSTVARAMDQFDTDYGNLIYCFGIIGFLSFFVYWAMIGSRLMRSSRIYFLLLFWMLGTTLVMSYRTCFIFQFLLSIIYSNDLKNKYKER